MSRSQIRPQTSAAYSGSNGNSLVLDDLGSPPVETESSVVLPPPTYGDGGDSALNDGSLFGESFLSSFDFDSSIGLGGTRKKKQSGPRFQKSVVTTPAVVKHSKVSSKSPVLHRLAYGVDFLAVTQESTGGGGGATK
jgi:hypothetical protein